MNQKVKRNPLHCLENGAYDIAECLAFTRDLHHYSLGCLTTNVQLIEISKVRWYKRRPRKVGASEEPDKFRFELTSALGLSIRHLRQNPAEAGTVVTSADSVRSHSHWSLASA